MKKYRYRYKYKKPNKPNKHLEFSKRIFYMLTAMISIVCLYSMALMWHTGDTSGLAYLVTGAFGAFSVGVGFYYDKAKKENIKKFECTSLNLENIGVSEKITYEDDSALGGE